MNQIRMGQCQTLSKKYVLIVMYQYLENSSIIITLQLFSYFCTFIYIYKELEYIDTWNILMRLNLEQTVRRRNLFFIIIIHLKIVVPVTNAFLGHILALILQRNKARKTCLNIHISY